MILPMLATLADAPLDDPQLAYEPKYDGIRAIAEVGAAGGSVRLWSRLGNEKTRQFPEIADALKKWAARLKAPVVLDGEIVALDAAGAPAGFQQLQGRIHVGGRHSSPQPTPGTAPVGPTAFIVFDFLQDGRQSLRDKPLRERRRALEQVFGRRKSTNASILRLSEIAYGDGRALYRRAVERRWEGLIAKRADSRYRPGKRTPDWRKLKLVHEQEFVVGGWTDPRESRSHFGALLIGVHKKPGGPLTYAGGLGTGFNERELARVMALLKPLATRTCPFEETPKTAAHAHWVKPTLVAQVKFAEWTADGHLRHPVYLGLRDDKKAKDVHREKATVQGSSVQGSLVDQLQELEKSRRDGAIDLPGGDQLKVTNLHKMFWPKLKLTKGDLLRYYAQIAPAILPAVADRPLVMKRFPNGVDGQPFFQHRALDVAPGVRTAIVEGAERRSQIVGGDLMTLLYMAQLASISQDPWFSRVTTPGFADYAAFDLDPAPGVPFARVLDVARWIHDELDALGATGVPKTSGADGLHIYVRLPPRTPYEAGLIFCQIVATVVSRKHSKAATIERRVSARGKRTYIDCLQNIRGKTLATAYSARASQYAGVSMPLTWKEVDEGVAREDFTIKTALARVGSVGDLWAALRTSVPVNLSRVARSVRARG
jgi:bifunctional non-homologous end joining protein LigD